MYMLVLGNEPRPQTKGRKREREGKRDRERERGERGSAGPREKGPFLKENRRIFS